MDNPYQAPASELVRPDENQQTLPYFELASRFKRWIAALIDALLVSMVIAVIALTTGIFDILISGEMSLLIQLSFFLGGNVVYLALNGYHLSTKGQTLGKAAMNLQVVSIHDNKILPLWKIWLLRYFVMSLIYLIPVVGGLMGLINPSFIFSKSRRCLHDLIAKTRVINYYDL